MMSATYLAPTSYAVVRDREKFERELVRIYTYDDGDNNDILFVHCRQTLYRRPYSTRRLPLRRNTSEV